jgi:hypothetical protein
MSDGGRSRSRALPKNLIRPLPVQDCKDEGSIDLLSGLSVHANGQNEETTAAAQWREEKNTN